MTSSTLYLLTIILALAGGAVALTAVLAKSRGRLRPQNVGRLYYASYVLAGLSVLAFVLRGCARG